MDFRLSEEQLLIQQSIREFAEETAGRDNSYEVLKSLADIDFLGIFFPEEFGGAGADFTSYILAVEELAKTSASTALVYSRHCSLAAYAIHRWGSAGLKEQYLPQLFKGERIGGLALGEGGPERDLLAMDTSARKERDHYILNGTKTYVANAGNGNLFIVFAKTGEDELSAFVLEGEAEGVSFAAAYEKMGLDGVTLADMTLNDVRLPAGSLLGKPGQGPEIIKGALEVLNISLAAVAVGLAQTAMEKSIAYGKERVQFGRPILRFEALQVMVGEMAGKIEAARLLTYQAAGLKDQNLPFGLRADMARHFAQNAGEETCLDAIQIHGGYGYSKELGVEKLLRDVKGIKVFDTYDKPLILAIAQGAIS